MLLSEQDMHIIHVPFFARLVIIPEGCRFSLCNSIVFLHRTKWHRHLGAIYPWYLLDVLPVTAKDEMSVCNATAQHIYIRTCFTRQLSFNMYLRTPDSAFCVAAT
jgi:hypothetical protein